MTRGTPGDSPEPGSAVVERRSHRRYRLAATCMLSGHDATFAGQLENISLNGALIRFEEGRSVPRRGEYDFTVCLEDGDVCLRLIIEVVCVTNGLTGITFVPCDADTGERLRQLAGTLTAGPDNALTAGKKIRKHLAAYLHGR